MRFLIFLACVAAAAQLQADSVDARCDVYKAGSDRLEKMLGCNFYQAQGHVVISRDDGVTHDLVPEGDRPGNYRDQQGNAAYRQSGLGDRGLIFRLQDESVFVYWDTAALDPANSAEENWTYPFTTADYDATTRLRCRAPGDSEFGFCPAGILRMEGGQASVVVQNQRGEQFTINFMKDYVNAANRQVEARLEADTWIVTVDKAEIYEVPLAAIEGG